MSYELARWAPGISLTWALISLAVGALIFGYVVVRIVGEYRDVKAIEEGEEI